MKKVLALALMAMLLLSSLCVSVAEEEFDWRAYEGTTIQVAFVEHTTANAIVSKLDDF